MLEAESKTEGKTLKINDTFVNEVLCPKSEIISEIGGVVKHDEHKIRIIFIKMQKHDMSTDFNERKLRFKLPQKCHLQCQNICPCDIISQKHII